MKKELYKRGFKAVKEEEERRERVKEIKKGRLLRLYFRKDDDMELEIPTRFLIEEPFSFWEHTIPQQGGGFLNVACIGDGCPYCENEKPRYVSAWLVVDHREFTYDEKKNGVPTGQKKTVKDRIKLLVRGMTDAAQLERLSKKYGLVGKVWAISRTGKGTSTKWNFDRGDNDPLTAKQEDALRQQLPEKLKDLDWDDIVISQIEADDEDDVVVNEEVRAEVEEKVSSGVVDTTEDEDDEPKKITRVTTNKTKPLRKR